VVVCFDRQQNGFKGSSVVSRTACKLCCGGFCRRFRHHFFLVSPWVISQGLSTLAGQILMSLGPMRVLSFPLYSSPVFLWQCVVSFFSKHLNYLRNSEDSLNSFKEGIPCAEFWSSYSKKPLHSVPIPQSQPLQTLTSVPLFPSPPLSLASMLCLGSPPSRCLHVERHFCHHTPASYCPPSEASVALFDSIF
jgi:hypothetical protein